MAGRIGWVAKAIVYSLIGGLCCRGAISNDLNVDASPQVILTVTALELCDSATAACGLARQLRCITAVSWDSSVALAA